METVHDFNDPTKQYESPASGPLIGEPLFVLLRSSEFLGNEADFDAINGTSLDCSHGCSISNEFVPPPGTALQHCAGTQLAISLLMEITDSCIHLVVLVTQIAVPQT
jgi:hypothetical protein